MPPACPAAIMMVTMAIMIIITIMLPMLLPSTSQQIACSRIITPSMAPF